MRAVSYLPNPHPSVHEATQPRGSAEALFLSGPVSPLLPKAQRALVTCRPGRQHSHRRQYRLSAPRQPHIHKQARRACVGASSSHACVTAHATSQEQTEQQNVAPLRPGFARDMHGGLSCQATELLPAEVGGCKLGFGSPSLLFMGSMGLVCCQTTWMQVWR